MKEETNKLISVIIGLKNIYSEDKFFEESSKEIEKYVHKYNEDDLVKNIIDPLLADIGKIEQLGYTEVILKNSNTKFYELIQRSKVIDLLEKLRDNREKISFKKKDVEISCNKDRQDDYPRNIYTLYYSCPACEYKNITFEYGHKFCPHCGTLIKWTN